MKQFLYDKLNSFGQVDLASPGNFPDSIDLGEGGGLGLRTVDIRCVGDALPAGGTDIEAAVEGADDDAFSSPETLGQRTITLEQILAGKGDVAVAPSGHRYLRVTLSAGGTFTAGTVEAFVNPGFSKS
jgi:hypothetical protein